MRSGRYLWICIIGILCFAGFLLSGCVQSPEAKSAKYIEAGKKLLKNNDPSRAILQFRNAAQATPKNAEAFYQLSLAYFTAGNLGMGVASLRKALDLNPRHPAARLRMAQLMSMASDPDLVKGAEQRLDKLLEESPDDADALHALAFTELKLGDPETAIQHLGRAMALAPKDLTIALSMSEARLQQHDVKGAEEALRKAVQNSPKSPYAAVLLGSFYTSQKQWAEAEQWFRTALSLDPNSGQALYNLAKLQNSLGRKPEAEQTFKRLSALPDKNFKATYAMFLFEQNRRDEAIREFEKLAKEDPEDRQARTRVIAAYLAVGRGADAERALDGALKKNPKDSDALLQRGEMLIASGKYDRAETDLNQVLHLRPDSADVHYLIAKLHQARGAMLMYRQELAAALKLHPYLLVVRLELAQSLLADRSFGGALELLDAAPESQKQLTPVLVQRNWALWASGDFAAMRRGVALGLAHERSPDFLIQDGVLKIQAGDPSGARAVLQEALKINPADMRALTALKQSYLAQKQGQAALQKVKEYAAQQPQSAPVQEFLATMLMVSGERAEARAALRLAKAADPQSVQADLSLVRLDATEGKWDDAASRLKTVLSNNPGNITARLWLGDIETIRKNYDSAMAQFRQVIQNRPNDPEALNNLAYLLADYAKQPDEALQHAEKAQELRPDNPDYADTMGWVLYQKGLYPLAVKQLERAVSIGPNPISKYHLAMAYAKAGNPKRAEAVLDETLRQYPGIPAATAALELIRKAK